MATSSSAVSRSLANKPSNSTSSCNPNLLYKLKITLFDDHCADEEGRWRRVVVPANFSLYGLHIVIREVFGWQSYHMHCFTSVSEESSLSEDEHSSPADKLSKEVKPDSRKYDPVEYKVVDGDWVVEYLTEAGKGNGVFARHSHVHQLSPYFIGPQQIRDERVYKLSDVFNEENRFLEYEYDFGASWSHVIEFEEVSEYVAENGEYMYPMIVEGKGANRMEDNQDENSDGELRPSFKRKKFGRQQAQKNLRRIFDGKWPLQVDNLTASKCYMCTWFSIKRGGCRAFSCDGKCCGVCLKSEFIRESTALSNEEAHSVFAATKEHINKVRNEFLESRVCSYREKNGAPCAMCNK